MDNTTVYVTPNTHPQEIDNTVWKIDDLIYTPTTLPIAQQLCDIVRINNYCLTRNLNSNELKKAFLTSFTTLGIHILLPHGFNQTYKYCVVPKSLATKFSWNYLGPNDVYVSFRFTVVPELGVWWRKNLQLTHPLSGFGAAGKQPLPIYPSEDKIEFVFKRTEISQTDLEIIQTLFKEIQFGA